LLICIAYALLNGVATKFRAIISGSEIERLSQTCPTLSRSEWRPPPTLEVQKCILNEESVLIQMLVVISVYGLHWLVVLLWLI